MPSWGSDLVNKLISISIGIYPFLKFIFGIGKIMTKMIANPIFVNL
jgi:hypothetical protein